MLSTQLQTREVSPTDSYDNTVMCRGKGLVCQPFNDLPE